MACRVESKLAHASVLRAQPHNGSEQRSLLPVDQALYENAVPSTFPTLTMRCSSCPSKQGWAPSAGHLQCWPPWLQTAAEVGTQDASVGAVDMTHASSPTHQTNPCNSQQVSCPHQPWSKHGAGLSLDPLQQSQRLHTVHARHKGVHHQPAMAGAVAKRAPMVLGGGIRAGAGAAVGGGLHLQQLALVKVRVPSAAPAVVTVAGSCG